jgi:hypothetical protein
MYNALFKSVIALVALWLEAEEHNEVKSVFYVHAEDVSMDDPMDDPRITNGKHIEVTVRVVDDDDDYKALFARHMARQHVSDVAVMEADYETG